MLPNESYYLSSDEVSFLKTEHLGDWYSVRTSRSTVSFLPYYLKSDEGYITFDEDNDFSVVSDKESANWWTNSWYNENSTAWNRWEYVIVNFTQNSANCPKILLKVDDGEPYFVIGGTVDENNIATTLINELCRHENMYHHPAISPTCYSGGTIARTATAPSGIKTDIPMRLLRGRSTRTAR